MSKLKVEELSAGATRTRSALPKSEQQKIARRVGYAAVREQLSTWDAAVERNREASQVDFTPAQRWAELPPALAFPNAAGREGPLGGLAQRLEAMKLLTAKDFEQRGPAQGRQRALMLYHELKAKRLKKIKSKMYRKRHRRVAGDAVEDFEALERRRIEERATLRHRAKGKFAKLLRRYGGETAATALQKDLRVLRSEVVEKAREAGEAMAEENDSDSAVSEELDNEMKELEEAEPEGMDMVSRVIRQHGKRLAAEAKTLKENEQQIETLPIKDSKSISTNVESRPRAIVTASDVLAREITAPKINITKIQSVEAPLPTLTEGVSLDRIRRRLPENIAAAETLFENTALSEAFAEEKAAEVAEAVPRETVFAGWGEWTGPGFEARIAERQRALDEQRQERVEAYRRKRADGANARVIVNEQRNTNAAKFMVDKLPFGTKSREEFDRTVATPIGREWTGARLFDEFIKPTVVAKPGLAILPIDQKHLPKTKYF